MKILASLAGSQTITVSDIDGFAEQGGMIQFVLDEPYVRFVINNKAAQQNGITFNSQLLALAKFVIGGRSQ